MKRKHVNKRILILILGGLAAIGPFSIDMYLPAFGVISRDLNTDIAAIGYSLTAYFFGICFGQLLYGPLIDRFGTKRPLLGGLMLFIATAAGCAVSLNVNSLIALRAFQALGGCVGMVAGRAIVRDLFPVNEIAEIFSSITLVMGIAPIIAPTVGGFIVGFAGWRYIFWALAVFGAFMFVSTLLLFSETAGADPAASLRPVKILKNYFGVLKNSDFAVYTISSSALASIMFAYISGSPFIYMKLFGLTEQQFGWVYAVNSFGLISGSQSNRLLLKKFTCRQISLFGTFLQVLICLSLIAAAANVSVSHVPVFILIFLFLVVNGVLNPNMMALAMEPFAKSAGSASAMLGFMNMLFGALATCLVSFLQNGTAVPMAVVMAVCALISFVSLLGHRFLSVNSNESPAMTGNCPE